MVSACLKSNKGFYVGDICYALRDDIYRGVWGKKHDYEDGSYEADEYEFAVAGTAYGDGCYYDQYRREFLVDAGVIGVVPLELVDHDKDMFGGHVFKVSGYCWFESDDGLFKITLPDGKKIYINTVNDDTDDEDYDDEEYDEEDEEYDEEDW